MTEHYSEEQAIAAVASLTRSQLISYVQAELVVPLQTDRGLLFRQIDIARLELLCELNEQFGLEEDALGVILSLIDQLHLVRSELRCVLDAIAQEPDDVRVRLERAAQLSRAQR